MTALGWNGEIQLETQLRGNMQPDYTRINIAQTQERVEKILHEPGKFVTKIKKSDQILWNNLNSKVRLVVLYADVVDSTMMAQTLPPEKLATMMETFSREMSLVVLQFNGFVLKYVGDAIIAYFPIESSFENVCNDVLHCSQNMITVLKDAVNPILQKHGYDELKIRIGVDTGDHSVVEYVLGEKHEVDILGYGISIAAKISNIAKPNQTIITHKIFFAMNPSMRKDFTQIEWDPRVWKYFSEGSQSGVWESSF